MCESTYTLIMLHIASIRFECLCNARYFAHCGHHSVPPARPALPPCPPLSKSWKLITTSQSFTPLGKNLSSDCYNNIEFCMVNGQVYHGLFNVPISLQAPIKIARPQEAPLQLLLRLGLFPIKRTSGNSIWFLVFFLRWTNGHSTHRMPPSHLFPVVRKYQMFVSVKWTLMHWSLWLMHFFNPHGHLF